MTVTFPPGGQAEAGPDDLPRRLGADLADTQRSRRALRRSWRGWRVTSGRCRRPYLLPDPQGDVSTQTPTPPPPLTALELQRALPPSPPLPPPHPRRHRRSWTTGNGTGCHLETNPSARRRRTTVCPTCSPDRCSSLRLIRTARAFEIGPRTVSRGDLLAMVRRLAAGLRDADLGPGKGVGCCRERRGRRRVTAQRHRRRPGVRGSAGDRRRRGPSPGVLLLRQPLPQPSRPPS